MQPWRFGLRCDPQALSCRIPAPGPHPHPQGHELGLAVGASGQAQSLDQLIPYFDFFTTE